MKTCKLKWLAHFESHGGQEIIAPNREVAVRKGEAAARRLGTTLSDITGPDNSDEEE